MDQFFRRLKGRGPDEMEQRIAMAARGNAYGFLVAALVLWTFWKGPNLLPGALLAGALLVQAFSRLILTRNAVKDDEDSLETGPLQGLVLLTALVLGVAVAAGGALLFLGVRP